MLSSQELNQGHYADQYFNRARRILKAKGKAPKVLMQVFPRREGILCGIEEVIKCLKKTGKRPLKIESLNEGTYIQENETVLTIEGRFDDFVHLETVYLGILARMSSIATNVYEIIDAAKGKDVIMMSARFERPEMQIFDGYAAYIGGCRMMSTSMNCVFSDAIPVGTIPHALIAAYGGDTVKATKAFDEIIDKSIPRVALVDFDNDCIKTSLEAAKALKKNLYAVRLDTSKGMIDKGLKKILCKTVFKDTIPSNEYLKEEFSGVCPELVRQVRENLDKEGFKHVKIVVSGGFTAEKIKRFIKEKVPFDAVGVGSAIYSKRFDFTADVVRINGKECAKVGRKFKPNKRLEKRK